MLGYLEYCLYNCTQIVIIAYAMCLNIFCTFNEQKIKQMLKVKFYLPITWVKFNHRDTGKFPGELQQIEGLIKSWGYS